MSTPTNQIRTYALIGAGMLLSRTLRRSPSVRRVGRDSAHATPYRCDCGRVQAAGAEPARFLGVTGKDGVWRCKQCAEGQVA